MQNPVEEIVLLSPDDEHQRRDESQISLRLQNSPRDHSIENEDRSLFSRLFKPTNRSEFYKNVLLWVILFGALFIVAGPLALHYSYMLPAVKSRSIPLKDFSEERARDYYPALTQYGPRVSNTLADHQTRHFLLTQIDRIRSTASKSVQFDINLQNFTVEDIDGLQNIAVRLFNANSPSNTPCLMLVAHYDSVEFSPGGSDDGSGVVILLELLSNLVNDPLVTFTQVHLIVLFTSAEEMDFNGAEAFVRDHGWKNDIRRFINIDSTGGHEKAILFRVKPSQLVLDYARVPRPHANVIGDEILEATGSDTDYSIFTTKGSLLGYDFAFYLDGYNYHTPLDKPSIVEEGALQHLGENTLALSRLILQGQVDLEKPTTIIDDDNLLYFDVLGRYLITYRSTTSTLIQSILIGWVLLTGIVVIVLDHLWYGKRASANDFSSVYFYFKYPLVLRLVSILIFFLCYLLSMISGIIFPVLIAFIISKIRPLSWYGNSTLAFFLYGLPCVIGIILCETLWTYVRRIFFSKYPKKNPMEIGTIHHIDRLCFNFERHWALLLVFVLLMFISIGTGYRSLYLILLWSIFICTTYPLLIVLQFVLHWRGQKWITLFHEQSWYWLFAPYLVSLLPLIHTFEMTSRLARLAIPIMGRIFHPVPVSQDIIICSLIILPTILFVLIFIPNIQRTMNFSRTLLVLAVAFLVVFVVACVRQPFTAAHPKIIRVQHVSQTLYQVNQPKQVPLLIPISSRTASITVESFDNLILSPTLDQISRRTNYALNNRSCSTPTLCSFDDAFNRTMTFKQVELTSIDSDNTYSFTVRHSPSYQIMVSSYSLITLTVRNASVKPRTETIVEVKASTWLTSFDLKIKIERCDLADSPFLVALTEKVPYVVMRGSGRCRTIADSLLLSVRQ